MAWLSNWIDSRKHAIGHSLAGAKQRGGPVVPFIPLISGGMSLLGGILGKSKTPTPSTPTAMPTQDTALTMEAKRRSLIQQQQRGGRASTVLSDNSDNTFGGN